MKESINQSEFARLQSLIEKAEIDQPIGKIDIEKVFEKMASHLKDSSRVWRIILRLYEQEKEIQNYFLKINQGTYKLLKEVPKLYDLEFFVQQDAWWDMVKGKMPPMEAFHKSKMRIRTIHPTLVGTFFLAFRSPEDKEKEVYLT